MAELPVISSAVVKKTTAPIKIMQFGEGNFLRGFIDWMVQKANDQGVMNAHVVLVQPLPFGRIEELRKQDFLYTVILQGLNENKEAVKTHEVIDCIDDAVNPYTDFAKFLEYGASKDLEVIVSNTTEAGITFDEKDVEADIINNVAESYPGKLYSLLYHRFSVLGMAGEIAILPCELIDDNGDKLREVLIRLANARNDANKAEFIKYLEESCHFTSSLVDRITPGFPRDEFAELCNQYGYVDNNMVKAEYFNLLVYRHEPFCEKVFPLHKVAAPVHAIYVDDVHPYKQRKVRILNGSHTSLVPVAYLAGKNEVRESLLDAEIGKFMKDEQMEEIVPTVHVKDVEQFAHDVFDRFMNPYVHHALMAIALNSLPKWKERDLPIVLDCIKNGKEPRHLEFAFASLIKFYDGYRVVDGKKEEIALKDDEDKIEFMRSVWDNYAADKDVHKVVVSVLSNTNLWDHDLTKVEGLEAGVEKYLNLILSSATQMDAIRALNAGK